MIGYRTPPCRRCGTVNVIMVTSTQYQKLEEGDELIQNILPEVDASLREQLISGICGSCFDDICQEED